MNIHYIFQTNITLILVFRTYLQGILKKIKYFPVSSQGQGVSPRTLRGVSAQQGPSSRLTLSLNLLADLLSREQRADGGRHRRRWTGHAARQLAHGRAPHRRPRVRRRDAGEDEPLLKLAPRCRRRRPGQDDRRAVCAAGRHTTGGRACPSTRHPPPHQLSSGRPAGRRLPHVFDGRQRRWSCEL